MAVLEKHKNLKGQSTSNTRLLLVEDDRELAQLTSAYLENYGYKVQLEFDGHRAIDIILNDKPDLVILDLMLPGLDGIEICRLVRSRYLNPILMLTARSDPIDQILGLEMGADDYVCKPVEPRLLATRVKALLRRASSETHPRQSQHNDQLIKIGRLTIDGGTRSVLCGDSQVSLSNPEYELLWLLAKNAGNILSRQQIFESLRGINYDGQNRAVDIYISHIRMKIGDSPTKPTQIKTVRNRGYMMVKPLSQ